MLLLFGVGFSFATCLVWLAFYQSYALAASKWFGVRFSAMPFFSFAALLSCVLCFEWNRFCPFLPGIARNGEESAHAYGFQSIEMETGKPTNKTPTTLPVNVHIARCTDGKKMNRCKSTMLAHSKHDSLFSACFLLNFSFQITTTAPNILCTKQDCYSFDCMGKTHKYTDTHMVNATWTALFMVLLSFEFSCGVQSTRWLPLFRFVSFWYVCAVCAPNF